MNFSEYVDDLAKRGVIDGHIAEMLCGKHRDEVKDPMLSVRLRVSPILDEMFHAANGSTLEHLDAAKLALRGFAERIDDELEPEEGDAVSALADEASELVESMGLNPPYVRDERFDGADPVEEITDNDCDRPCVGDVERALNLVVRLAALNGKGGAE